MSSFNITNFTSTSKPKFTYKKRKANNKINDKEVDNDMLKASQQNESIRPNDIDKGKVKIS